MTMSLYISFGMLGLVIVVFFVFQEPKLGLLLIIFVNAFDNLIQLPIPLTIGRAIGILVSYAWFIKYFCSGKTGLFYYKEINPILLYFTLSMCASSVFSTYPAQSLKGAITVTLMISMVFFIQDFIKDSHDLDIFIKVIVLSVGIASLVGIVQYKMLLSGGELIGDVVSEGEEHVRRLAGFYHNPNGYGAILMSGIPFLFFLSINESNLALKFAACILLFTSLLSLVVTLSRTHLLGFIAFVIMFIFHNFRYKNISWKQFIFFTLILIVLSWLSFDFLFKVVGQRSFSYGDFVAGPRYQIMLKGIQLALEHPLIGIGFNNFEYFDEFGRYGLIYGRPGHDIISILFASTGLLGILIFSILCYRTTHHFHVAIQHFAQVGHKKLFNLCIVLKSAFLSLLITCVANPIIYLRIFWIYLALAVVLYKLSAFYILDQQNSPQ